MFTSVDRQSPRAILDYFTGYEDEMAAPRWLGLLVVDIGYVISLRWTETISLLYKHALREPNIRTVSPIMVVSMLSTTLIL